MYHGEHGIALPAEIGIDAKHETHHDAIYAVSPQIAGSHLHDCRVFREDARQRIRQELGIDAHGNAEDQGHGDA